jgi:Na+/H+-dicarboxylate symporter
MIKMIFIPIIFLSCRLAVGVSQHGNLEEKLKMAFDIYGK